MRAASSRRAASSCRAASSSRAASSRACARPAAAPPAAARPGAAPGATQLTARRAPAPAAPPAPRSFSRELGSFQVGPFAVPAGQEKAKLKVRVRLNLHGLVGLEGVQAVEEQEVGVEVGRALLCSCRAPAVLRHWLLR